LEINIFMGLSLGSIVGRYRDKPMACLPFIFKTLNDF